MAWIIGDSFDFYAATIDATGHWYSIATTTWALSGTTRFGAGQSMRGSGTAGSTFVHPVGSNEATLYAAVAHYHNAALVGTTPSISLQFRDTVSVGGAQCTVVFESSGNIVLKSGGDAGSVLATYTSAFTASTWNHFQIKVVINNTTGSFAVRKNGASSDSFSATGLNTRGYGANNYANHVAGVTGADTYGYFDDLLFFSGAGAAPNTWVGDVRAVQMTPNNDTAQRDFARSTGSVNYVLVDEALPNGDTDYVYSSTVGHKDLYDLNNPSVTPSSIIAVQSRAFAKKSDTGARSGQVIVKSGATEVVGTDTALGTSYGSLSRVDTVDPNTTAAWTMSAINVLQVGAKVTA